MKKVLALLASVAMATTAFAQNPVLVGTYYDAPSGNKGLTVSINWNDAATASGFFALTATSTNIIQVGAFGGAVQPTTAADAYQFGTLDPSYIKLNDSYWLTGSNPGFGWNSPWTATTPPFNGTALPAGNGSPGVNSFSASYGTGTTTPVSGTTPILQLVTNDPEGDINVSGTVSRLGADYQINQNFTSVVAQPILAASGGNAGNVRIGTSGSLSASASNIGSGNLTGSFPAASGEFGGGPAAFGPLGAGGSANQSYSYTPTGHGADSQNLTVTSNGGNVGITLAGTGVGPEYADDSGGMVDVGDVYNVPPTPGTGSFTISNVTGDGNLGGLTDLTITSVTVINNDGKVLFSTDLAVGTVIPAGGSQLVNITGTYGGPQGPSTGTLIIGTDVGAALGGDGADFTIALKGNAVPEPSTVALAAFGALGLVGLAVRRRNA